MNWKQYLAFAFTMGAGTMAWGFDPDARVWNPQDGVDWIRQARSLADVAVRGVVTGVAAFRTRDHRGHALNLLCLSIDVTQVYFSDVELDHTVDVCVANTAVATPDLVRELALGDEIVSFAHHVPSGRLRVALNRTIVRVDGHGRALRTADQRFVLDDAVLERELEVDQ